MVFQCLRVRQEKESLTTDLRPYETGLWQTSQLQYGHNYPRNNFRIME